MAAPIIRATPTKAWRPPQWSKPAMVMVTVPAGAVLTQAAGASNPSTGAFGAPASGSTSATSYVFDAVLDLEHEQTLTKTNHPVQGSAAISSHAYIEPSSLVIYVLMSDVSGSYTSGANQATSPYIQSWTGNPSKSVSAYQQMLTIQNSRVPLTVTTRLRTYSNMLITRLSPKEDSKTITGARFRVEFGQIFVASTQTTPTSTRPNDTASTGLGAVNSQPVPGAISSQFSTTDAASSNLGNSTSNLLSFLSANPSGVNVPGAGTYSSVNTNSLQQLPSPP